MPVLLPFLPALLLLCLCCCSFGCAAAACAAAAAACIVQSTSHIVLLPVRLLHALPALLLRCFCTRCACTFCSSRWCPMMPADGVRAQFCLLIHSWPCLLRWQEGSGGWQTLGRQQRPHPKPCRLTRSAPLRRAKLGKAPSPAPRWLGNILAAVLTWLGSKGLEFAQYSIDYHYIRWKKENFLGGWGGRVRNVHRGAPLCSAERLRGTCCSRLLGFSREAVLPGWLGLPQGRSTLAAEGGGCSPPVWAPVPAGPGWVQEARSRHLQA